MEMQMWRRGTPGWDECRRFVHAVYRNAFGADVLPNPDNFIAIYQNDGGARRLQSCAGITFHAAGGLYAQAYVDGDLTAVIADAVRVDEVFPEEILEVGPVAATGGGTGLALIEMLPFLCWTTGAKYAVCTLVQALWAAVEALGIDLVEIAKADLDALPKFERRRWGTYYDLEPVVGFMDIRDSGLSIDALTDARAKTTCGIA